MTRPHTPEPPATTEPQAPLDASCPNKEPAPQDDLQPEPQPTQEADTSEEVPQHSVTKTVPSVTKVPARSFKRTPGPNIQVHVGRDKTSIFRIKRHLACSTSRFFARFPPRNRSSPFLIYFSEEDPDIFKLFAEWVETQPKPLSFDPDRCCEEPWLSSAVKACKLGMKLQAPKFEQYALSQFIQGCSLLPFGPWEYIEKMLPPQSPLRRFSNHWVAWNSYLIGGESNEYTGLEAASLSISVTKSTPDPRTLDLSHWYLSCGKLLGAECSHDPLVRLRKREELVAAKKRFARAIRERSGSFEMESKIKSERFSTSSSTSSSELSSDG